MKTGVIEMFSLLDEYKIRYYLLRPIDLNDEIKDLDIIVPKEDLDELMQLLLHNFKKVLYKKSHANASIQLMANDILLDIKFVMCFLPGKSLLLPQNLTYSGIKKAKKNIIVPNISEEILFTFWTYHLFLDKLGPEQSSTFLIYKKSYQKEWKRFLATAFFENWSKIIFKDQYAIAIKNLESYFENNMIMQQPTVNSILKNILFKSRPLLLPRYYYDKIKYAIYRRTGIHGKYKEITKTTN